ncbi:MAG: PQQ-binding-like beta-propeller repeat protein [Vicinamibacteria bacterium]
MKSYAFIGGDPGRTFVAGDEGPKLPLSLRWRAQGIDNCAMTSPLKEHSRIVVCDDAHGDRVSRLYCFDAGTGYQLWNHENNAPGTSTLGCLVNGLALYYRSDEREGHLRALRIADGSLAWENREMHVGGSPLVVAGRVILDWWDGSVQHIAMIEPEAGDALWRKRCEVERWPMAVGDGLILLREDHERPGQKVACISLEDGRDLWQSDLSEVGRYWDPARRESVPGGAVVLTAIGRRAWCPLTPGKLACLDLRDGSIVWTRSFDRGAPSTPIPADGKVYFTTMESFHCLEAATGRDVFSVGGIADESKGSPGHTSGFIAGDYYFYAGGRSVYARDRHTGKTVWRYEGDSIFTPPFFSGGSLYTSCLNGHVYCFGPE